MTNRKKILRKYVEGTLERSEALSEYPCSESQFYRDLDELDYETGYGQGQVYFNDGHMRFEIGAGSSNEKHRVYIHQLFAVSLGYNPHLVFSDEWDVHHKNGVPWDNRQGNIGLLTHSEHSSLHNQRKFNCETQQ